MAAMVDTISASELKQTLDQFVIIDVREQDELANGTIDGSTHMPLGLAIRNVKQGKIDELKEKKICNASRLIASGILCPNCIGSFAPGMKR